MYEYVRSVQNSPSYPEAHTHFPSTQLPPFIHIALHVSPPPLIYKRERNK